MVQGSGPPPSGLSDKTSRWFDRAKAALLDELPCSRGCSLCCVGLFPVTILDRQAIQQGLRSLCSDKRQAMVGQATAQVRLIEMSAPQLAKTRFVDRWADRDMDTLAERYRELACPALQSDGSCGLYAFRPLTCRSMGIPHEVDGVVHGACAVQTSVPLVRLSRSLRQEEDRLIAEEAEHLARLRDQGRIQGEEMLLPYAFLPDGAEESTE